LESTPGSSRDQSGAAPLSFANEIDLAAFTFSCSLDPGATYFGKSTMLSARVGSAMRNRPQRLRYGNSGHKSWEIRVIFAGVAPGRSRERAQA